MVNDNLKQLLETAIADPAKNAFNYKLNNLEAQFKVSRDAFGVITISYQNLGRDLPATDPIKRNLIDSTLPRDAKFIDESLAIRRALSGNSLRFDFGRNNVVPDPRLLEESRRQVTKTIAELQEEVENRVVEDVQNTSAPKFTP